MLYVQAKITQPNGTDLGAAANAVNLFLHLCIGTVSVRRSVSLSHSPAAAACGGFAAVGPAGRIAARPALQQHGTAARRATANAGSATFTTEAGA